MHPLKLISLIFIFSLLLTSQLSALEIPLEVKETKGVARSGEMVRNGVPIAKSDGLRSIDSLVISDGEQSIPATFEVLARWGGWKDDNTKPIKWLMVAFPSSQAAYTAKAYYLRDHGVSAPIQNSVIVQDGAGSIVIQSGGAEFVISKTEMTLFESIALGSNVIAATQTANNTTITGGSATIIQGQAEADAQAPVVTIERQNAHYVCIKAVGQYGNIPQGSGLSEPIHYRIRYEFFAGSSTAIITHKFFWPGYDGSFGDDGSVSITSAKLILPQMVQHLRSDVYASPETKYTGVTGQKIFVSQNRRTLFADDHQATLHTGSTNLHTRFATDPAVVCHGSNGSLAATIGNMKFFESQRIDATEFGQIIINSLSDTHEFADAQGTWARVGVSALPSGATQEVVLSEVVVPVEHRLMAIASPSYFAATKVFDRTPDPAATHPEIQTWKTELTELAETSVDWFQNEKFHGLMTWGTAPRYDDETGGSTSWDKIYQQATMTDYHNAWLQMTLHGLISGDVDKITDFAFPAARRMLHTQITQANDYVTPSSAYMGWAPCGYGRYRADFNSSHSYFENLFAYYFLTGDLEVVDLLSVGAKSRDGWYTRNGEDLNNPADGGVNWVGYTGRVFYQASTVFDFLGHVSDARFLDDWKHMYNNTASNSLLLLHDNGKEYVFFTGRESSSPVNAGQSWMDSIYTVEGLYRLWLEYGDIDLGAHNLSISRILKGAAQSYWDFTRLTHPGSDDTWNGSWSNVITVNYSGDNFGGTLDSIDHYSGGSDPHLYADGKGNVAVAITRAGVVSQDSVLKQNGLNGLTWLTQSNTFLGSGNKPLGKVSGLIYSRLADGLSYFVDDGIIQPSAPKGLSIMKK